MPTTNKIIIAHLILAIKTSCKINYEGIEYNIVGYKTSELAIGNTTNSFFYESDDELCSERAVTFDEVVEMYLSGKLEFYMLSLHLSKYQK